MKASPTWNEIRKAKSYREFLAQYLVEKAIRAADLARAAGFHRGFPQDVISGKRRLTANSAYAFEKAMRVPANGKKLFRLLVAMEETDVFPELDRSQLPDAIQSLRAKPWGRASRKTSMINADKDSSIGHLLRNPLVPMVFAATGNAESGALFSEIQVRTKLESKKLQLILDEMVHRALLRFEHSRYFSHDLHVHIAGLTQNEYLPALISNGFSEAKTKARDHWQSDSELFLVSSLCVQCELLPKLKKILQETVLSFIDDHIDAEGDQIVKIALALHT